MTPLSTMEGRDGGEGQGTHWGGEGIEGKERRGREEDRMGRDK